jgi:hypothetical protein
VHETASDHRRQTFLILVAAFGVSLVYEIYRDTVMAGTTQYDTVGQLVAGLVFYAIAFGVSALLLTDKGWAWWVVTVFLAVLLVLAALYYMPTVFPARAQGFIDAFEAVAYLALLGAAMCLCINRLRGTQLRQG